MNAAKAIWTVSGGIVHGTPEFERRFSLTSEEWEQDGEIAFQEKQEQAVRAFQELGHPTMANWVTLELVWL